MARIDRRRAERPHSGKPFAIPHLPPLRTAPIPVKDVEDAKPSWHGEKRGEGASPDATPTANTSPRPGGS